jgi:ABC-type multidrug transport system fused ATPase/permease subunit
MRGKCLQRQALSDIIAMQRYYAYIFFTLFSFFLQSSENAPLLNLEKAENALIEFKNITFGYNPNAPILNNLSFRIEPGKKVAIVGGSGSG